MVSFPVHIFVCFAVIGGPYLSSLLNVAQKNTTESMKKLNKGKAAGVGGSRRRGSEQTAKGTGNLKNVGDVWKSHNVKVHVVSILRLF